MKTKFRRLALTAMLLSGTSLAFADQGTGSMVGDLPGFGEDAYFDEDAAYAVADVVDDDSLKVVEWQVTQLVKDWLSWKYPDLLGEIRGDGPVAPALFRPGGPA